MGKRQDTLPLKKKAEMRIVLKGMEGVCSIWPQIHGGWCTNKVLCLIVSPQAYTTDARSIIKWEV